MKHIRFSLPLITLAVVSIGLISGLNLLRTPQEIREKAQDTLTCNSYNLVSGGISPNPIYQGGRVTVTCNYGANIDCIAPSAQSNLAGCSIVSFKNNLAIFSCKAPSSPGTYNYYCGLFSGSAYNCCSQSDYVGKYTVKSLKPIELSYWIHLDVNSWNNSRGYWYDYKDKPENPIPTYEEVKNTLDALVYKYYANRINLLYHRQFEIDKAKDVFNLWKQASQEIPSDHRPELVPMVVAINYGPVTPNFTVSELSNFAQWLKSNINSKYFAFYDVYTAQGERDLKSYATALNGIFPGGLLRHGIQPKESLPSEFDGAIGDTWSAQAAGTDEYWDSPPDACGLVGKPLLKSWVERRVGDSRKFAYNLIVVGWDYDVTPDPVCDHLPSPGDDGQVNDPVPLKRAYNSHHAITEVYNENNVLDRLGGYSTGLGILNSHTKVQEGSNNSLYVKLINGQDYTGRFAEALNAVASVYKIYNPVVRPSSTPTPTNTPTPTATNTPTPKPTTTNTPTPTNTPIPTATNTPKPTKAPVAGDANGDGYVDMVDYLIWVEQYGNYIPARNKNSDFNNDGKVDGEDFTIWMSNYSGS